jgi:RHS repeat-associated protein
MRNIKIGSAGGFSYYAMPGELGPIYEHSPDGSTDSFLFYDLLRNARYKLVAGSSTESFVFSAMGEELANTMGTAAQAFNRFQGQVGLYIDYAGFYYARNRFLDAGLGRFNNPDQIGILGGYNEYLYANNDPVNMFDPLGYEALIGDRKTEILKYVNGMKVASAKSLTWLNPAVDVKLRVIPLLFQAKRPGESVTNAPLTGHAGFLQVYSLAKAAGDPHPEITAAQWAQESAWGRHVTGTFNYFGIKDLSRTGSYKMVMTHEYEHGRNIAELQPFLNFPSLQAAIDYRVGLMRRNNLYARYGYRNPGTEAGLAALTRGGYATDQSYAVELRTIIKERGVYQAP